MEVFVLVLLLALVLAAAAGTAPHITFFLVDVSAPPTVGPIACRPPPARLGILPTQTAGG